MNSKGRPELPQLLENFGVEVSCEAARRAPLRGSTISSQSPFLFSVDSGLTFLQRICMGTSRLGASIASEAEDVPT